MTNFYDRQGRPLSLMEWAESYEHDVNNRHVGDDERNGVRVSTIWTGIDHNWGEGRPLIFETMVFGGPFDQQQWRWHSEKEAVAGHAEICSAVLR